MTEPTSGRLTKAEYDRERRKDPKVAEIARARARAAGRAYRILARRHHDQYTELYEAEKTRIANDPEPKARRYALAQSRARVALKKYHVDEYRALYQKNLTREGL